MTSFAILMAVYEKDDVFLFSKALNSVYTNSVIPNEFILVVDGPISDVLANQITIFKHKYLINVIYLSRNMGLAHALNAGLKYVTTDWVVRADADDVNLPFRFEKQLRFMSDDFDLIGGAIQEVEKTGEKVAIRRPPLNEVEIRRFAKIRNPFNHMTIAFRKSLAERCGGYPHIYLKEDYALWALMLKQGARCINLHDILVEATAGRDMYRRRGGWRYAKAEIKMQRHLVECDIKSLPEAIFHGFLRGTIFLLPSFLRAWIFECFLRDKFK
jgi:glycosyltransferase involved in cell wall biosynthesis